MHYFIKFILFSLVFFGLIVIYAIKTKSRIGKVILLNGTSSSGKSTILNELHKLYPDYKIYKIDDFFPKQVKQKAKELGWKEDSEIHPWSFLHKYMGYYFDTELRKLLFNDTEFYQKIRNEALQGNNVIVDTVLEYEDEYKKFDKMLGNLKVIKILIYCPLDILLERVQMRNKLINESEHRLAFQSFEQFPEIYKLHTSDYEPIVDIINTQEIKEALIKASEDFIKLLPDDVSRQYKRKVDNFNKNFIEQFNLNKQGQIVLSPLYKYNLIFDSSKLSMIEIIKQINTYLGK